MVLDELHQCHPGILRTKSFQGNMFGGQVWDADIERNTPTDVVVLVLESSYGTLQHHYICGSIQQPLGAGFTLIMRVQF